MVFDGRWVGMTGQPAPPPKFADQLQAFWLALEPAARGAGVVWGLFRQGGRPKAWQTFRIFAPSDAVRP